MEKDFEGWNAKKKMIDSDMTRIFCHSREIWWCSLGVNVGFEQDGTGRNYDRPVVVIKSFNKDVFWGAALTSKEKIGAFRFPIGPVEGIAAWVLFSQIRFIDTKRLVRKIATLDDLVFEELKNALNRTLFD